MLWGKDGFVSHCLALSVELDKEVDDELLTLVTSNPRSVYGVYGLGCWHALNNRPDDAIKCAHQLAESRNIDSVILAIEIALLAKKEDEARQFLKSVRRDEIRSKGRWDRENLYAFYASALLGSGEMDAPSLLESARQATHPNLGLSNAYWHIGLLKWLKDDEEYISDFAKCVDQRQFVFTQHAWSRAILERSRVPTPVR